uniref:Uncharacterized protein n=1 Tax=Oryza rufipogon TaxID=4529 RepID=A0A0E0Q4Z2_ORYRU
MNQRLQIDSPTDTSPPPPRLIAKCPARTPEAHLSYNLVECGLEIQIWLPDLMLGMVVLVSTIGCNSLFLGKRNLCVNSSAFLTIVSDTIVFYHHMEFCLAQYNLGIGPVLSLIRFG